MSMTESEAIKRLQTLNIILTDKAGHEEDGIEKIFTFSDITAICTAIQALEEVEQYRAIGTVEQLEWCKDASHWKSLYREKLEQFEAIGTIERFRELTEKAEPKKPIGISLTHEGRVGNCPCCNKLVAEHNDNKFCSCNQRLAWQ